MLFEKYGGLEILNTIRAVNTFDFYIKILEKQRIGKKWDLYLTIYPNFSKDTFVTFEEYSKPPESEKTEEEILEDVELILLGTIEEE